jgi:hypothetical protein
MSGPFEMIGDANAESCEDGVCAVPVPEAKQPEDAERHSDDSADAGPGGRVPVQR